MMMRRFKHAGEVAIHMLTRLLEFDPSRRLTCDEAMQHEYFAAHREDLREHNAEMMVEAEEAQEVDDELSPAVERQLSIKESDDKENANGRRVSEAATSSATGVALRLLEDELDKIMHEDNGAEDKYHRDFFSPTTQRLLAMLTAECEAVDDYNAANGITGANGQQKSASKSRLNKNDSKTSLVEDIVMDDAEYAMACIEPGRRAPRRYSHSRHAALFARRG